MYLKKEYINHLKLHHITFSISYRNTIYKYFTNTLILHIFNKLHYYHTFIIIK